MLREGGARELSRLFDVQHARLRARRSAEVQLLAAERSRLPRLLRRRHGRCRRRRRRRRGYAARSLLRRLVRVILKTRGFRLSAMLPQHVATGVNPSATKDMACG